MIMGKSTSIAPAVAPGAPGVAEMAEKKAKAETYSPVMNAFWHQPSILTTIYFTISQVRIVHLT